MLFLKYPDPGTIWLYEAGFIFIFFLALYILQTEHITEVQKQVIKPNSYCPLNSHVF